MSIPTPKSNDTSLNQASEDWLPLVYDELRHLAAHHMAREGNQQTLQATALVHEAWLRLANKEGRCWNNREHFFRAAALAMRHILVDKSREKASQKRGQNPEHLSLDDVDPVAVSPDARILLIDEALTQLETEDPESAQIITLKFFGGFTNAEVANIRKVSISTIERQWAYAKSCMFQLIQDNRKS